MELFKNFIIISFFLMKYIYSDKGISSNYYNTITPSLVCPKDYKLEGHGCVKTVKQSPKLYCPKKAKMSNDGCKITEYFNPQFVCPQGYVMKGKKCYKLETTVSQKSCPKDYYKNGDECISKTITNAKVICPKGYTMNGNDCVMTTKISSSKVCPHGYEITKSGECVMNQFMPPSPTCPKGYHFENDECVKATSHIAQTECPKGFKLDTINGQFHKCTKYLKVEAQPVCAKGQFDGKKSCIFTNVVPPIYECNKGYQMNNGKCTQYIQSEPTFECSDKNFHLKDGQCVKYTHIKPDKACIPGYTLDKGKCYQMETTVPTHECNSGIPNAQGECWKELTKSVETSCPKGYTQDDMGTCKIVKTEKAQYFCEQGEMKGKSCSLTEYATPTNYCQEGILTPQGSCMQTINIAPQYFCPKGYDMDITGKCVQLQKVEPNYVCPPGSNQSPKGHCESKVYNQPEVSCPKGYSFAEGYNGVTQACVKEESIHAQLQCPPNTFLKHDMCYSANSVVSMHEKGKKL